LGMDYRFAQLKSRGKLKDVSQLHPAMQFDDGRVGCLSCHNPDSPLKAKLVASNAGSRLCMFCHEL
jgi:predicted CXXCH cytochrome family protein